MITELMDEPITLQKRRKTASMLADVIVVMAHEIGEACESGQNGMEATDSSNRIITCKEVSSGNWQWVDTGRIRS